MNTYDDFDAPEKQAPLYRRMAIAVSDQDLKDLELIRKAAGRARAGSVSAAVRYAIQQTARAIVTTRKETNNL